MSTKEIETNLELASELVEQARTVQLQLAPIAARVIVDAVKSENASDELLQLIGIVSGQGLKAEDLLQAIRNEIR
ncbi:hypothetical protein AB4455_12305 [Vibrio sp. 10N.261.46.E12]|uniref:hypothetical protein n=1 Tax=unclassified Vibrio TaxID=2614977 RepID=UPI000975DB2A|nr:MULTISPECIES: hypothetical protein [unclassified Vibrio]OMO34221.1 hypothetical protein BH584_13460 [Vibrio sp. 10N.261.45.E1]PMJ33129.1 hypothetical protein BCU27_25135 [Vibrio sp. 10N.286.45.B6]PML86380.1 hypothetical protein BCT66_14410 [Vibrio sp. 10N.261.49.E11]PMM77496.1 hypothetical protein BCT48_23850 [Vibrio sp. 10N.261.46.F12]PMM90602.1 hypothetical protein BCT46_03265 [Vibrio sp. 10N.261.46.E8]